MSAETLRRAASLMRERAGGATEVWGTPVWEAFDAAPDAYASSRGPDYLRHHVATADEHGSVLLTSPWDDTQIVRHAASWHPLVALAVADWLDAAAGDAWEQGPPVPESEAAALAPHVLLAIEVARAYLGEVES